MPRLFLALIAIALFAGCLGPAKSDPRPTSTDTPATEPAPVAERVDGPAEERADSESDATRKGADTDKGDTGDPHTEGEEAIVLTDGSGFGSTAGATLRPDALSSDDAYAPRTEAVAGRESTAPRDSSGAFIAIGAGDVPVKGRLFAARRGIACSVAPERDPPRPDLPVAEKPATPAGTLTAGSFDDNRDRSSLEQFLGKLIDQGLADETATLFERYRQGCSTVLAQRADGRPVADATVTLDNGERRCVVRTGTDGRAMLDHGGDGFDPDDSWNATCTTPDGTVHQTTWQVDAHGCGHITLDTAVTAGSAMLDLALVLDCTGSMGDELRYLQQELETIVTALRQRHPDLAMRFALVAYRDKGDDYITKISTFTDDLATCLTDLGKLRANGGGDAPEAVDQALIAADGLAWSPASPGVARVLVHVADAPPHAGRESATLEAVNGLRAKGVAIYPVAGSGIDQRCEALMRISAALTGARYLWLTDDSGVGNAHAEPHLPYYHVEKLAPLLVRLIDGEIRGRYLRPRREEIVRTSGTPPADELAVELPDDVSQFTAHLALLGATARATGENVWAIAWADYDTTVQVTDGNARIATRDLAGELLVAYQAAVRISDDGTMILDGRHATLSGPEAERWSPDSFVIAPDLSVRTCDDVGQTATGAGIGTGVE